MTRSSLAPTLYLSAPDIVRLVQREGLPQCIAGVAAQIEADFRRWARLRQERPRGLPQRRRRDRADADRRRTRASPSSTSTATRRTPRDGLPTVMAFGVLADVDTGAPRLLSELTIADRDPHRGDVGAGRAPPGAARTAARWRSSATARRPSSRPWPFATWSASATLRLFDVDAAASAKLVANLAGQGLAIQVCASIAEAVRGADIVTTVTADKRNATIITPEMLAPGMHFNAVGGDCPGKTELHRDVLAAPRACSSSTSRRAASRATIQQMPADFAVTEFWQVLGGSAPGRRTRDEVTVFDSVGFALEDYAALVWLERTAARLGLGDVIDLVPALDDPKNLFGLLGAMRPVVAAAEALPA